MKRKSLYVVFVFSLLQPLSAQQNTEETDKTWGVIPLVVPLYSPETRFMVVGGGGISQQS